MAAAIGLLLTSCEPIQHIFNHNPREDYVHKIEKSPIIKTPIAKKWIMSGDSIVYHPVTVKAPFKEKVIYFDDEPNAWAWQISLKEGRSLHAHLARSDTSHQVFMDLFVLKNGKPVLEKATTDSLLSYSSDQTQTLILRIQAVLLINGSATLSLTDQPSMEFPVEGGIRADIGGVFGDPRAGGKRRHKGVDIFAKRGTPVLAVAPGWVMRTGNHGLGGKQVWLRAQGKSIYYAHLDSVYAHNTQHVQAGDTLGFVGNTGNARNSPPHLHFGIYAHGAIDPLPFIDFAHTNMPRISADPTPFVKWGQITLAKANVRPLPSTKKASTVSLARGDVVHILGGTETWYQVKLPDDREGFIYESLLKPTDSPLHMQNLSIGDSLFTTFDAQKSFFISDSSAKVEIYGHFRNRQLTKLRDHWIWIKR